MDKKIVLGSKSPRRQKLIQELGFPVELRTLEVEENYPEGLQPIEVPAFLAQKKSLPLRNLLANNEVLVCADTIVLFENEVLGKPLDSKDAIQMLTRMSGKQHEVYTGVCIFHEGKEHNFTSQTSVFFSQISQEEIKFYVEHSKPFDKAGSYGIQEWIGYIGVEKIHGCYYNVMGLPLHDLYRALKEQFNISISL